MGEVGGRVEPGFEAVREAFGAAQAADEGGAQLCVYRHGRPVVDIWAGTDKIRARPYTDDILTVLMSCSKGAVAACAHILAERGQLDFDAPVARYWPEFAQGGKADARVWQVLSHSVGLPGLEPETGIGAAEMLEPGRAVAALAEMAPLWAPGTAIMYHPVTYGTLMGEVIRRITGRTVGQFFAEEIGRPLGLDLWIGLPQVQEDRVAEHFAVGPQLTAEQMTAFAAAAGLDVNSRLVRTVLYAFKVTGDLIELMKDPHSHVVEVPAGNAVGDARSLARLYAALIGEVDGVRLIAPATVEKARTCLTEAMPAPGDLAKLGFGEPQRYGLGFELPRTPTPMLGAGSFGHAGAGGRIGFAHPESGVAVAYVANTMISGPPGQPDPRWVGWTAALRAALRL